ncbi:MAG: hypothetical protein RLY93_05760 [Sumerlaeia bacterium]
MKKSSSLKLAALGALALGTAGVSHAAWNAPTTDGDAISSATYTLVSLQTEAASFGATNQLIGLWAANDDTNLYLGFTGNLDNNAITVFIDSQAGGNTSLEPNTAGGYGEFDSLASAGGGALPQGFTVDLVVDIGERDSETLDVGRWTVTADNAGAYLGNVTPSGTLSNGYSVAIDNTGSTTPSLALEADKGVELVIPLSDLAAGPGDIIELFAVLQGKGVGDPNSRYVSNQTLPPSVGQTSDFASDGAGNFGTPGVNYDGSVAGPDITPLRYQLVSKPANLTGFTFVSAFSVDEQGLTNGDLRGIAFNPATSNSLISDEDANVILVMSPDTLTTSLITNVNTPDGTVDPYKVDATQDGTIFTSGFSGSVKMIANDSVADASASPIIIAPGDHAVLGSTRAFRAIGDHSAGQATLFIAKGTNISIFRNSPDEVTTYTLQATLATAAASDLEGIGSNESGTVLYAQNIGENVFRYVGTPQTGYTLDAGFGPALSNFHGDFVYNGLYDAAISGGGYARQARFVAYSGTDGTTAIGPGATAGPDAGAAFAGTYEYDEETATSGATNASGGVFFNGNRVWVTHAGLNNTQGYVAIWDANISDFTTVSDWSVLD